MKPWMLVCVLIWLGGMVLCFVTGGADLAFSALVATIVMAGLFAWGEHTGRLRR